MQTSVSSKPDTFRGRWQGRTRRRGDDYGEERSVESIIVTAGGIA